MLNDYLDWPGVGQVYRLERKFDWVCQGKVFKTSCEIEYGITSLANTHASPTQVYNFDVGIGLSKPGSTIGGMSLSEKMPPA